MFEHRQEQMEKLKQESEDFLGLFNRRQEWDKQVTASEIGNKPLKKVEICQILGGDIRLKGSCAGYGPDAYAPIR